MYFEIDDYNALDRALHQLCLHLEAEHAPEQAVFDSKLVACELLSNVLQHGGERAYFSAALEGNFLRLRVRGNNGYRPPEKTVCADVTAECGRGLFLIDAFCESREYSEKEGICVVIKIRN